MRSKSTRWAPARWRPRSRPAVRIPPGLYAILWAIALAAVDAAVHRSAGAREFALCEGADKNKDQSYFLALLSQDQLRDARFPIGDLANPHSQPTPPYSELATRS